MQKPQRLMDSELSVAGMPYVLPFDGTEPHFADKPLLSGSRASVLGKVRLGARAILGPASVIRADGHYVQIGDDFALGECSTVHIAHELYPAIVGNDVAVGRNAVVHACTVGNDCVIEDDAVILDGSLVPDRIVVESRSVVYPRSKLESGFIYAGSPAKPVRELSDAELLRRKKVVKTAIAEAAQRLSLPGRQPESDDRRRVFVGRTALLSGRIDLQSGTGILFSCILDAGLKSIVIGANTNVQDNTRIQCLQNDVIVGGDTTIGHNVELQDCRIGARCMIGIGSRVASGTIIEEDVLLAAGSTTSEGQLLESGWIWAGRPARPRSRLDDARRSMMRETIRVYLGYGDAYRQSQRRLV